MQRIVLSIAGVLTILALAWFVWPAPIDPAFWDEPEAPAMTGVLAPNDRLASAQIIARDEIENAEDLILAPDGSIYMGSLQGNLQRLTRDPVTGEWSNEILARVSNRALLGAQWIDETRIAMASISGLYMVDVETLEVRTLSTGSPSRPFGFVNDVEVGPDGTIYFSDSTVGWTILDYAVTPFRSYELMENRPHGFIYTLDPNTGATRVLLERLHYPNGVTLSSDGEALFIAETTRHTIRRYELSGPNAGELTTLASNLPGMADGMMSDGQGRLFVAIASPRRAHLRTLRQNPVLMWLAFKLGYRPALSPFGEGGFIIVIDEVTGEIIDSFQGGREQITSIANVIPDGNGTLWIASDGQTFIARMDLAEIYSQPTPSFANR